MDTVKQTVAAHDLKDKALFSEITLTNAYQAAPVVDVSKAEKAALTIKYTRGSGETSSSVNFKLTYSLDNGATFGQESAGTSSISAREYTVNPGTGSSVYLTWTFDIAPSHVLKVSAKESGVVTNYGKLTMILGVRA
jgi:hypothetical protein